MLVTRGVIEMQKVIVGLLIICIGLIGGNVALNIAEKSSLDVLHEAFEASSAELVEVTLNAWGDLSPRQSTEEQLKQAVRVGAQAAFNVTPNGFKTVSDEGFILVQAEFRVGEWLVDATAQNITHDSGAESYLVVTMTSEGVGMNLTAGHEKMKRFFFAAGSKPDLTACLVGSIEGSINPQEAARIVGSVLGVLRGEMQESYSDAYVTTLTGYSSRLPGGITIAGRKSNISLTMRYNPEIGSTLLWFAWPTFTLSV